MSHSSVIAVMGPVVNKILLWSRGAIKGIRFYHFSGVRNELVSALAISSRCPIEYVGHNIVKRFSADNIFCAEPFLCITHRIPVRIRVASSEPERDVDTLRVECDGRLGKLTLSREPCESLGERLGVGREWCDVPLTIENRIDGTRRVIGKLSCDLKQNLSDSDLLECLDRIDPLLLRSAPDLDYFFLRDFEEPLILVENSFANCETIPALVNQATHDVSNLFPNTEIAIYLYEHAKYNGGHRCDRITRLGGSDPYAAAHSAAWTDGPACQLLNTESDVLLWAARHQQVVSLYCEHGNVHSCSDKVIGDSMMLRHGNHGALLVVPIYNEIAKKKEPVGIATLRRREGDLVDCIFHDTDVVVAQRIFTSSFGRRIVAVRDHQTASFLSYASETASVPLSDGLPGMGSCDGAIEEISRLLGSAFRKMLLKLESGNRTVVLLNLAEKAGETFRTFNMGGTTKAPVCEGQECQLDGSFTKLIMESENCEGVEVLPDVPGAIERRLCMQQYSGYLTALGARISFGGRVYGAFVVLSDGGDVSLFEFGTILGYVARRAGAALASREVIRLTLHGMANDVYNVLSNGQQCGDGHKWNHYYRSFVVEALRGWNEMGATTVFLNEADCKRVCIEDEIRNVVRLCPWIVLGGLSVVGCESVRIHRPIFRAMMYKMCWGLIDEGRNKNVLIDIDASEEDGFLVVNVRIHLGDRFADRVKAAAEKDLRDDLCKAPARESLRIGFRDDWPEFGAKALVSFRIVRNLISRHSFSDSRRGKFGVVSPAEDICSIWITLPTAGGAGSYVKVGSRGAGGDQAGH